MLVIPLQELTETPSARWYLALICDLLEDPSISEESGCSQASSLRPIAEYDQAILALTQREPPARMALMRVGLSLKFSLNSRANAMTLVLLGGLPRCAATGYHLLGLQAR